MELEETILERLQELRRWQTEQQERLLKQQQEQRDLLSFEQDRMYQALGLSVQNIISEDSLTSEPGNLPPEGDDSPSRSRENLASETSYRQDYQDGISPDKSMNIQNVGSSEAMENRSETRNQLKVPALQLTSNRYLDYKPLCFSPSSEIAREPSVVTINSERTPEKHRERPNDFVMDGVEPLEKPAKKCFTLDDLPVPSPKKDFKTLLEERLREANDEESNTAKSTEARIKRPFLKKGEGLARFKPNPVDNSSNGRGRQRSSSLSASMRLTAPTVTKNNPNKLKETPKSSRHCAISGKSGNVPATAQTKLCLKNVAPPKNKIRSKSMSAVPRKKPSLVKPRIDPPIDMNASSDIETKSRRELEEMRIFELLEEKAENSSFCSNSSAVMALFRQSTPVKGRNAFVNKIRENRQRENIERTTEHPTSDTSFEEIVRTTRSNMMPDSPVTKIRETVIHKDYVISQWDGASERDENINTLNSNRVSNRSISAGTFKTTKHTTIQFNNNNNINNNNGNDDEKSGSNVLEPSNDEKYENNDDFTDKRAAKNLGSEKESGNVSLHVRFSEYNEYKTIDLTDTSIMSNNSNYQRNYEEDKAWSDRSTSPDSSDVEVLFSKVGRNGDSRRTSLSGKGLMIDYRKREANSCDEETTDQATDDEEGESTSFCSNDENTTITEVKVESNKSPNNQESSDHESENCNDSGSTIGPENSVITTNKIDSIEVNDTIFKSELLKTRLAELEREIDIFRKENAALAAQRQRLQDEARQLQKEYKLKEDNLEKERICNEEILQEEKKRLSREKAALENRLRDAREKSLQSKQERQEIQVLREQLDELREESSQKESRWQAAQARQKSQIRVLQTDNARLKQELEKLRASRTNNLRTRRAQALTNTRSIHQINKQLENKKNIGSRKDSSSEDEKSTAQIVHEETECDKPRIEEDDRIDGIDIDGSKTIIYNGIARQSPVKGEDELRRKRNMYAKLLNEATEGLRGNEQIIIGKHDKSLERKERQIANEKEERFDDAGNDSVRSRQLDDSLKQNYERTTRTSTSPSSKNVDNAATTVEIRSPIERRSNNDVLQESRRWSDVPIVQSDRIHQPAIKQQDIREIQCSDGHVEYWYPNGNVKKIYPDRNVTKMIYYNGDVRQTLEDGSVKYFYASTRTWHTTLPDGLEILEFPDGQVERRTKDGSNEVSFPDGSVRILQADGTEKWILPDGTVAETFPDGNKILSFPNGQREVHTNEHKRREYPDGTVKLVYPDGTQETRYSNGRVRVKDKDGNLLVDVHHQ